MTAMTVKLMTLGGLLEDPTKAQKSRVYSGREKLGKITLLDSSKVVGKYSDSSEYPKLFSTEKETAS